MKPSVRFLLILFASLLSATIVSCSSEDQTGTSTVALLVPHEQPAIHGTITSVDPTAGGGILVEENPADTTGSQKLLVRMNSDTALYRRSGSSIVEADRSELVKGETVSVWVTGPVAMSYPGQGTASVILIEGNG